MACRQTHVKTRGALFRDSFLCLVPLVAVSVPVTTKRRSTLEWALFIERLKTERRVREKREIHLVRSSMSTSMASCSTCSSSLNSSNCTSSSFRPVLDLIWCLLEFIKHLQWCLCHTWVCICVWCTHSESVSVSHLWWLATVRDSCLSCPLASDSFSSNTRWCGADGEAAYVKKKKEKYTQTGHYCMLKCAECE